MKKKFLGLFTLLLATSLVACGANGSDGGKSGDQSNPGSESSQVTPAKRYTVKFMNGETRVATESVKEGESLTTTQIPAVAAPEGYLFEGWSLTAGGEVVDLTTYVVNEDVTFYAVFKEAQDSGLSVDDKKEEGKTYYLVLGWWETTDKNDDGSPKYTSHLTKTTVRLFYQNLINYLKADGATDENIANIQFRNYASGPVADMGAAINADGDVDIMIGVGNNINSTAGVKLHNESNDYKFQTPMGDGTARYVACLSTATDLGVKTYEWLRDTTAGVASFVRELTAAEIAESLKPVDLNFTVNVHGDSLKTTVLHTKSDLVEMPAITIPDNKVFKGFALSESGEVALDVAKDAKLKYDDLVDLVAEGVKTIDLYPVLEDKPVVLDDLVVYVQIGSSLKEGEAKLLEARFNATLTTEKIKFNYISGDAATFSGAIGDDSDIIIGGNNPVNNLGKHADGPTANVGAKHFISTNRKIIISDKVATGHLDLAKQFYAFATAAAPEFAVHTTFWPKTDNSWLTADEVTNFTGAITTNLKTFLDVGETDTLEDKYNVKVLTDSVTTNTANGKDKVADLGAATAALRDGKGTDLVVGCGNNIDTASGLTVLEKRAITVTASGRYAALLTENCLTRSVFDGLFPASN